MSFNLLHDPFISVSVGGCCKKVGLLGATKADDITLSPIPRIAVIRLLIAIAAWEKRTGKSVESYADWFDIECAFQSPDVVEKGSAFSPLMVINCWSNNNPALCPNIDKSAPETLALALLVGYFQDKSGQKSGGVFGGTSSTAPPYYGKIQKLKRGKTIRELMDNNPIDYSSEYQPPWETGEIVYPLYKEPKDELELLLWPHRALRVEKGNIIFYNGSPISNTVKDPFCDESARLKDVKRQPDPEVEQTIVVTHQAKIINVCLL